MEHCAFEEIIEHGLVIAVRDLSNDRIYPMISGGEGDEEDDEKVEPKDDESDKSEDEGAAKEAGASDDDAKDDSAERDADDTGDKGQVGLKKRLSKVSAALRAYKQHGTPEEYAAAKLEIAKYKKYEKEIEDEERAAVDAEAKKKGIPTDAEQNAQLDRILERRFGKGASEDFAAFRDTRAMEVSRHVKEGHAHLRQLLTEHGLGASTKGEAFDEWDRHIGAAIRKNPERYHQFRNPITQHDAIDAAFMEVKRFLVDPAVAATSAGKLKALERRRAAAPSSAGRNSAPDIKVGASKPPDKLKGAARSAWWDKRLEDAAAEIDAMDEGTL